MKLKELSEKLNAIENSIPKYAKISEVSKILINTVKEGAADITNFVLKEIDFALAHSKILPRYKTHSGIVIGIIDRIAQEYPDEPAEILIPILLLILILNQTNPS